MNFDEIRDQIIKDIETHAEWHEEVSRGKMFGFLIHEGGVLKAYSGQILGRSDWEGYVPAIYDYLQPNGYFKTHENEITSLNARIKEAEALLPKGKRSREVEMMKAERKECSQALQRWLYSKFIITSPPLTGFCPPITGEPKGVRRQLKVGRGLSLLQIFTDYARRTGSKQTVPPSGTGECCAPKLLNYANKHGLKPLAIAEFWYGDSPKGIIRHHGQFYEPCQSKCMPILWYMKPDDCVVYPFMRNYAEPKIEVIWQDDWFIAINKPAGLLSVPGKRQLPNAQDLLNKGVKAIHRLDMDTSGILLFAKTEEAFVKMQQMFAKQKTLFNSPLEGESIQKEYVAVLSSPKPNKVLPLQGGDRGGLSLPLSPDFENRPMQKVDYENGKEAITQYEFIDENRIRLFPLTGRTHQLRIHCAHPEGLNRPILGDPLYGNTPAERMYLHASRLSFTHPFTGDNIEIKSPAPF